MIERAEPDHGRRPATAASEHGERAGSNSCAAVASENRVMWLVKVSAGLNSGDHSCVADSSNLHIGCRESWVGPVLVGQFRTLLQEQAASSAM